MTSSVSPFPGPAFSTAEQRRSSSRRSLALLCNGAASATPVAGAAPAVPLLLAAVLCLVALLVAPEQPRDQEAICQRHNGVEACRVW